jgi:hypothetical protein
LTSSARIVVGSRVMSSMAGSFPVTRHPEVPAEGGPRRTTADVRQLDLFYCKPYGRVCLHT